MLDRLPPRSIYVAFAATATSYRNTSTSLTQPGGDEALTTRAERDSWPPCARKCRIWVGQFRERKIRAHTEMVETARQRQADFCPPPIDVHVPTWNVHAVPDGAPCDRWRWCLP